MRGKSSFSSWPAAPRHWGAQPESRLLTRTTEWLKRRGKYSRPTGHQYIVVPVQTVRGRALKKPLPQPRCIRQGRIRRQKSRVGRTRRGPQRRKGTGRLRLPSLPLDGAGSRSCLVKGRSCRSTLQALAGTLRKQMSCQEGLNSTLDKSQDYQSLWTKYSYKVYNRPV